MAEAAAARDAGDMVGVFSGANPAAAGDAAMIVLPHCTQNLAPDWISYPHVEHFIAVLPAFEGAECSPGRSYCLPHRASVTLWGRGIATCSRA